MIAPLMATEDHDRARFDARRALASAEPQDDDPGPLAPVVGLTRCWLEARTIGHRQATDLPMAA